MLAAPIIGVEKAPTRDAARVSMEKIDAVKLAIIALSLAACYCTTCVACFS